MRSAYPHAIWIDLLSPAQQRRYAARPEHLRELVGAAPSQADVVIDEVQRVPELLTVVHQLMEEPGCPRFVLAGSSSRQLKRAGVDLLAGRATRRTMHPFMAAELGRAFDLDSAVETGLLPLIWDARDPVDTLDAYVGLYVQQEVQSEGLARSVGAFLGAPPSEALSGGLPPGTYAPCLRRRRTARSQWNPVLAGGGATTRNCSGLPVALTRICARSDRASNRFNGRTQKQSRQGPSCCCKLLRGRWFRLNGIPIRVLELRDPRR